MPNCAMYKYNYVVLHTKPAYQVCRDVKVHYEFGPPVLDSIEMSNCAM